MACPDRNRGVAALSFPLILDPVDLVARIADIRVAGEPGEPGGSG